MSHRNLSQQYKHYTQENYILFYQTLKTINH